MKGMTRDEEIIFRLILKQYIAQGSSKKSPFLYDFERAEKLLESMSGGNDDLSVEPFLDHKRQVMTLRTLADKDIIEIDYVEEVSLEGRSVDYRWHNGYEWACSITKGMRMRLEDFGRLQGYFYINADGEKLSDVLDMHQEKYSATLRREFDHVVVHCNDEDFLFLLPKFPVPQGIIDYATSKTHLNKPVTQEELIQAGILRSNEKPQVKNAFRNSSTFADTLRPFITLEPRAIIVKTTVKLTESEYRAIAGK